jgi:hypothetical protein
MAFPCPAMDDEDFQKCDEKVARLMSRTKEAPDWDALTPEVWAAAHRRHYVKRNTLHVSGIEEDGMEDHEEPYGAIYILLCRESAIPDRFEMPEPWQPAFPGAVFSRRA